MRAVVYLCRRLRQSCAVCPTIRSWGMRIAIGTAKNGSFREEVICRE